MSVNVAIVKEDSLKRRYFFKLFANVFSIIIGFIVFAIVPRALGPKSFGDYSFLTAFFIGIVAFLEMCTSKYFYTKLSQKQNDNALVWFYFYFNGIISAIIIAALILSFLTLFYKLIWPGQAVLFISLAAGYALLFWISQILNKVIDAYGLTVKAEIISVIQKSSACILLIIFFFVGKLNLFSYFCLQYSFMFMLGGLFIWILKSRINLFNKIRLKTNEIKDFTKQFYDYSHPLFIFGLICMLGGIFDRWLLQLFGGGAQQGFYGLSYYLVTFCILFTRAMEPLLTRELSISFGKNNFVQMGNLFRRYMPLMYSVTAYFACFIALQSSKIIHIFSGQNFMPAIIPLTIMAFYPIHQTYGQLNGSVFYATGQTALYRNIGMIFSLIGLPTTFFLIAPNNLWGIGAGAAGLAIKMVVLQFIAVNIELFFISKILKLDFLKYLGHQLSVVFFFLIIAAFSTFGIDHIFIINGNVVLRFISSGIIYTTIVFILIFHFPIIFGLKKKDIQSIMPMFNKYMKIGYTQDFGFRPVKL